MQLESISLLPLLSRLDSGYAPMTRKHIIR